MNTVAISELPSWAIFKPTRALEGKPPSDYLQKIESGGAFYVRQEGSTWTGMNGIGLMRFDTDTPAELILALDKNVYSS